MVNFNKFCIFKYLLSWIFLLTIFVSCSFLLRESTPALGINWSENFNGGAQNTWSTVNGGDNSSYVFEDDRFELHTESSNGSAKMVASYVNVSGSDYDLHDRFQRIETDDLFLSYILARVNVATMSGYVCGTSSDGNHLWFGKLTGGVYSSLSSTGTVLSYDPDDYQVRFAVFGTTLAAKVWTSGESEPADWQLVFTDASYSTGVAGIMLATYPTLDWDIVQVAVDDISLTELSKAEVWVDDDLAGSAVNTEIEAGKIFGYNVFATIQAGVNAVSTGGTVNIAAGTYFEEVSLVGRTDITLSGAGEGLTIIAPYRAYSANNYGIFINNSHQLLIQNLTIDGFANTGLALGVAHYKDGIHWDTLGGNDNIITHVTVNNIDRRGVSVWPETVTNNEISHCKIDNVTGVSHGGAYAHGINFNGSGKVEYNEISNVTAGIMGNNNVVGGTLSIQNNAISDLTGLTATPFDVGINIWCKQSNDILVKNNSITANVQDNTGIYVVRGGNGSEISNNTITLTGDGGLGIETGWESTWGFPIFNNIITVGRGGAGIVLTGAGSDADPMLVYNNSLTNIGEDDLFTNDYTGYPLREVGLLLSGHQYTSRTGDANYSFNGSVYNNIIDGFKDGIVFVSQVYDVGGYKDVEIKFSDKNSITNYEQAGRYGYISNTSPYPFVEINSSDTDYSAINAINNWWGSSSDTFLLSKIMGNITFIPYYSNEGMTLLTTIPDINGDATLDSDTPQVVITDPDHPVTVTIDSGISNPTIDLSRFITGGTGNTPEITIDSPLAQVLIPATAVTSDNTGWDGVMAAPTVATITLEETNAETKTLVSAIEIGFAEDRLSFDEAVRILFVGQKDKRVGYISPGEAFVEILDICANDDAETGNALGENGDCKINSGDDLVVWTKHFTTFAIYTVSIKGDINLNGVVDKYDFSLMMSAWGLTGINSSDLNDDHIVDRYDFSLLMLNWSY